MLVTRSTINCDTLAFFPHNIPFPKVSTDDYLKQATQDIIQLLTHPIAQLPYLQVEDVTKNAMLEMAQVLNRSITNTIRLENPTTKKTSHPSPDVVESTPPINNLPGNAFSNTKRLPRVQKNTISQLPRVQRKNPPGVGRSPRQHTH